MDDQDKGASEPTPSSAKIDEDETPEVEKMDTSDNDASAKMMPPESDPTPITQEEAPQVEEDTSETNTEIEKAIKEDHEENEENVESPASENKQENLDETQEPDEKNETELDETLNKSNEDLNYTEKSINISQITVAHNDDSNDAFNALKESETDALNTKEELPDPDDEVHNENEDYSHRDDEIHQVEEEERVEHDPDHEHDPEKDQDDSERPDDSKIEDEVDENVPESEDIGTTTEGEGIDENVCLLGDAEREITDADKERAVCATETTEDEETTDEPSTAEAVETTEAREGDADADDNEDTAAETGEKDSEEQEHEQTEDPAELTQMQTTPLKENEIREITEELSERTCLNCENSTNCLYQLLEESGENKYLCTFRCVQEHRDDYPDKYTLTQKKVYIHQTPDSSQTCEKCKEQKNCKYRFRCPSTPKEPPAVPAENAEAEEGVTVPPPAASTTRMEYKYLCDNKCLEEFIDKNTEKYIVKRKRYLIDEIPETEDDFKCIECNDVKKCKYKFLRHDDNTESYICNEDCLNLLLKEQPDNFRVKRRSVRVRELPKRLQATEETAEAAKIFARTDQEVEAARLDRDSSFIRRCAHCFEIIMFTAKSIQWETMDFCDEKCLGSYQNLIGAACTTCNNAVTMASLGKYCVRFGFDVKQFCCSGCLDVYKKALKQCTLCQRDLAGDEDIVLAKVGEKGQFKDFCNQICLKRYEDIINPKKKSSIHLCSVCNYHKPGKIEVILEGGIHKFCSSPCFSAFKFVNNVHPDKCDMCLKYFERRSNDSHTIYHGDQTKMFCSKICMNIYIGKSREIWQCDWCKVSKYNYDMIIRNFGKTRMCSLNCLTLYEVSVNALSRKRIKCDHCKSLKQPQYHLTMSDASIRNFCTYQCVLGFQSQFNKKPLSMEGHENAVVPAGTAKRIKPPAKVDVSKMTTKQANIPVISKVQSLNSSGRRIRQPYSSQPRSKSPIPVPELTVQLEPLGDLPPRVKVSSLAKSGFPSLATSPLRAASPEKIVENKTQVITIPPLPKQIANKSTSCQPIMLNKGISCRVSTRTAECQTEDYLERKIIIPLPVPIFIPQPMYMYNMPTPIPVPIPIPIPVPVFIPTTRNSANGIMKEIKKIQEKMPTDPYEAELLMMAEMVAGDKKREDTDSDSDNDVNNDIEYGDGIENNTSFNEDLVQMAFKMASGNDFDDPPVDLESEMTANTISQNTHPYGEDLDPQALHHHQLLLLQQQREAAAAAAALQANRNRKRMNAPPKQNNNNNRNNPSNKRIKREMEVMPQQEIPREPAEKPDANMCLKYTFGVNAWKQWVATKNADLEKSSIRRKPFKSEILQLTADELNYSLCLFVKEVRKPNGSEYAPDTIYYLVLGIQQYLYENGRIDNIFTDRYYEQFTDCLDEVAKKFSVLYNDSQYIVTRVEEEHLWECKQLGAHSPHVLLSTLMFFNTKHFNLVTVDEHMELSFSHIMKHWKRNPNQPGAAKMPGSRNVLLRFYPPQSSLEANSRKKKVYEQQENEENPLRCPVKLYEFYLSKCPESVKTRNDVFYLQPERSCVPDSPVWYSTQPLSREALSKMLHRVKMVKEINIALLTS